MISTAAFLALAMQCAPDIAPDTLSRIVKTESGFNPWAIGVVGKSLKRQPQNKEEALTTVKQLVKNKSNFSIGLAQINRQYFDIKHAELFFSPCTNLKMGANILKDCYARALKNSESEQQALKKSFSCYYSGNYTRGFKKENNGTSYVERIITANSAAVKVPALDDSAVSDPASRYEPHERPAYAEWDVLQQYPRHFQQKQSKPVLADKNEEEETDVKG